MWPGSAGPMAAAASAGGEENLCTAPVFTGWDVDGGYARTPVWWTTAIPPAYRTPWTTSRPHRCCAWHHRLQGLRCSQRRRVAPWGSTGSVAARLTARWRWRRTCACTCSPRAEPSARRGLRRTPVGAAADPSSSRWTARSCSLRRGVAGGPSALDRDAAAGRRRDLVVTPIPGLEYADELFQEPWLGVTANTRADGEEFLRLVRPSSTSAPRRSAIPWRGRHRAGRPRARPLRGRSRAPQPSRDN